MVQRGREVIYVLVIITKYIELLGSGNSVEGSLPDRFGSTVKFAVAVTRFGLVEYLNRFVQ